MKLLTQVIVGLERQIVIGKHSGKAAIVNKFKEYNIELTR